MRRGLCAGGEVFVAEADHAGLGGDGGGGGVFFHAAAIAAAAGIAIWNNGDVPQFTRHSDAAVQYFARANNATADAGTERQQHQIIHVLAGADPFFAQRRSICVVFQYDRRSQAAFDFVPNRKAIKIWQIV